MIESEADTGLWKKRREKRSSLLLMGLCFGIALSGCGKEKETSVSEGVLQENQGEEKMHEIEMKDYVIKYDGKEIFGKLYEPAEEGTYGAVILSHGYNGSHNDFDTECKELARHGYVAYAYDFCGGSVNSKSSLNTTEMTIFTEKKDLLAVFDDIGNLEKVDKKRIFLFGGSQGGLVSALTAAELGSRVKALALYYPALNIPDDWRKNFKEEADIPEVYDFWGMKLGKNFFMSIRDFNTFEHIGEYSGNVLIVYGDKDMVVPFQAMEQAKKTYQNVELIVLNGEGHGFSPDGGKKALSYVLEFLKVQDQ